MKIILVDDEPLVLEELRYLCDGLPGVELCGAFSDPARVLAYGQAHPVDFAFLDIQMPGMTGLELLKRLRVYHQDLQAAFVTAYDQYALEAYREDACDYLLKPFDKDAVCRALDKARRLLGETQNSNVEIHTFGRFDLFCGGKAVDFKSRKAKELLALLVARAGGTVDMDFAIDALWESESFEERVKVKFRKACMSLRDALREEGLLDLFQAHRGRLCLNRTGVSCDYFRLLDGDPAAARQFHGAFMSDYSWSEPYLPDLEQRAEEVLQTQTQ